MEPRRWHDHYPDGVPASIDYPEIPLHGLLDRAVAERPDTTALVFYGAETTYRDLGDAVDRFARSLQDLGIEAGDRVAVMLPNSPQFVVAFFGALKAGAVAVPTNPLYTLRELDHQWGDAGVDVAVTLDLFWDQVAEVRAKQDLDATIVGDVADELPLPLRLLYPIKKRLDHGRIEVPYGGDVLRFEDQLDSAPIQGSPDVDPADDVAILQYTGGTTGLPKGAMLTHRNLVSNTVAAAAWLDAPDVVGKNLSVIPFFHVYGLTVAMLVTIARKATQILHPDARDVDAIVDLIDEHRPEYFQSVPALFVALNDHPDIDDVDLTCLEGCFSGSAPLPLEVMREFEERSGADIVEGYGLTEASPITHANPIGGLVKPGTIGVPYPDTDARIVDIETGEDEVETGEPGELIIQGPQVMKGYWKAPEETEATLRDGWLYTGDIATVDEDGYFAIVDRKKDMILASGFNVYPREVEEVLYEHPDVEEAAVFGVPHDKRGETVACAIVARDGADLDAAAIEAHCRENLTAYKVPKVIEFMDELPKSAVQKTLKRELREMVEASP